MKRIVIDILGQEYVGDVKFGSGAQQVSTIHLGSEGFIPTVDEMAGLLANAYLMAARHFVESHHQCTDCAAFRFHNANIHRITHLMKEIMEKPIP